MNQPVWTETQPLCKVYNQEDQCPCVLVSLDACPQCSHLQGEDLCDCDWVGTCIYLHSRWQDPAPLPPPPEGRKARLIRGFFLPPVTYMAFCQVPPSLLKEMTPMHAISLVHHQPPAHLYLPGTILRIYPDLNLASLALYTPGTRETWLLDRSNLLRAEPKYRPAILGLTSLQAASSERVLAITSGYGINLVPALAAALPHPDRITVLVDSLHPYTARELSHLGVEVSIKNPGRQAWFDELARRQYGCLVSLGPEIQHRQLVKMLGEHRLNHPLALLDASLFEIFQPC